MHKDLLFMKTPHQCASKQIIHTFCVNSIIPSKQSMIIFPNSKPWITKELMQILHKKRKDFFSRALNCKRRRSTKKVKRVIEAAKLKYKNKVELTDQMDLH